MKLKSQNEHRRLYKPFIFILSIILTLSICSLEGFRKPYEASTYATTYGSYSFDNKNFNLVITNNYICTFAYSLNGEYNGRMSINFNLNYNTLSPQPAIIPINCYIESFNGTSITIAFKNQNEIGFLIVGSNVSSLTINSISNYNMTKITDGTNTQLQSMSTALSDIETTVNQIQQLANTTNTNVSDIENLLRTYFTDNNGTTVNIGDIILQFNEFNAQLQLQLGVLNDLKAALLDIDNKIDTITWTNHTQYNFQKASSIGGTLSNFVADASLGNTVYVYIPTTIILNNDYLYHFHFPIYTTNYTNFNIKAEIYDNLGYKVNGTTYIEVRNSRNVDVYVHPELTSSGRANYIKVTCSAIMYGNNYGENSSFYEMLSANDIEYYNLLSYFKNYEYQKDVLSYLSIIANKDYNSKLNDIINAINNISFTIDSDTVNNTETIIDNYNDVYTDIESIELQFINNFNTQNENIDKTIFNKNVDVTNAKNALETTLGQFMTNDYIKAIIYLFLLTVIIIRILG